MRAWSRLALAALAASAAAAARAEPTHWRFIDGPGVVGVLKPAEPPVAAGEPAGHVALRLTDRGYFEGFYNLAPNGAGLTGALWPEGGLGAADAAGFFTISTAAGGVGRGRVEMADGARFEVEAR